MTRRLVYYCGVIAGLVVTTFMVSHASTSQHERHILELEKTLVKARQKHDAGTVSSIVADEFQEWSFRGVRMTKADLLRLVKAGGEGAAKVEDQMARVYGDTAI